VLALLYTELYYEQTCLGYKTGLGVTLLDCIVGGVLCPTHPVGIWAGDAESYLLFAAVFKPILRALHPR
jgi:ATP:guanido phosphotransferase, N-terminal domain